MEFEKVYKENPIKKEIEEVIRNHKNRKAVIHYETEDVIREITYEGLYKISSTMQRYFEDLDEGCCIGLLMDHNPFIPSIILCFQSLNYHFMFLKDSNINDVEAILNNTKIIVSYNRKVYIPNYSFKNVLNLLWEHKLYIYQSDRQKEFNGHRNINYVIQTSGTTGVKKTVIVEHNCIYSNIHCLRSKLEMTSQDIIYFGTALTFDPSMVELYLALTSGACLLSVSKEIKENLSLLYKTLFDNTNKDYNISFLQMCPSVFLRWNREEISFILNNSGLRILLLGGENFPKILENVNSTRCRIFNIYGITEVSCWASMDEFQLAKEICLGQALNDTILEVRNESGLKIFNGEGELYIGSTTRICYINNESFSNDIKLPLFRKTGDLVFIHNNEKIFYIGRTDDTFKRYGIQVNSNYIEHRIFKTTQLENKLIYLEDEQKIVLFVKVNESNESVLSRICDKVRIKLLHSMDKEHLPEYIEAVQCFPIDDNGKNDKNKLKTLAKVIFRTKSKYQMNVIIDEVEIFKNLWKKYVPMPQISDNFSDKTFRDLGGTSILRSQFSNEFIELTKNSNLPVHFFDYLFTNPYSEVLNFIKTYKFKRKCREINCNDSFNKKLRSDDVHLRIKWRYDLKACVDTTPFVIQNKKFIAIGAFSNIFVTLNIENGVEVLKIILPNAIESSCLSTDSGEYLFVGCYNGYMYCIESATGNTIWSYETNEKIKNKPCFVMKEEAIVFGSYDKYLYCVEAKTGLLLWKTFLNSGMSADPIYLKEAKSIVASTLSGICLLIDINGRILWKTKVATPIFSSPCIFEDGNNIIIAEVQGIVYCLNSKNGGVVWNYGIDSQIYSATRTYKNLVLFTSHDCFMYCLKVINNTAELKFKIRLDSASVSSVEMIKIKNLEYLITASINGTVYLIDVENEIILNEIKLDAAIFSSPTIYFNDSNDVFIFIGCRDDNLYCIEFVK